MFGKILAVPGAILLHQPNGSRGRKWYLKHSSETFSLLSLDDGVFYSLGASFEEGCINAPFESPLPPSTPNLAMVNLTFRYCFHLTRASSMNR